MSDFLFFRISSSRIRFARMIVGFGERFDFKRWQASISAFVISSLVMSLTISTTVSTNLSSETESGIPSNSMLFFLWFCSIRLVVFSSCRRRASSVRTRDRKSRFSSANLVIMWLRICNISFCMSALERLIFRRDYSLSLMSALIPPSCEFKPSKCFFNSTSITSCHSLEMCKYAVNKLLSSAMCTRRWLLTPQWVQKIQLNNLINWLMNTEDFIGR